MLTMEQVRRLYATMLAEGDTIKSGKSGEMLEVIGLTFIAEDDTFFGKLNHEYADAELEWFISMSRNVDDLFEIWGKKVQIWDMIADDNRLVNSNYGHLAMHPDNGSQMDRVIETLQRDRTSRQAAAIYTRPSIHDEWNTDGKSDFICTNAVMYNIRGDYLHTTVQMRSNDLIFGYRADWHWHKWANKMVADKLGCQVGYTSWQVASAHIYERHFPLVEAWGEENL